MHTKLVLVPKSAASKKVKVISAKEAEKGKKAAVLGAKVSDSVSPAATTQVAPSKISTTPTKSSVGEPSTKNNAGSGNLATEAPTNTTLSTGHDDPVVAQHSKVNLLDIAQLFADSLLTEEEKSIIVLFNEAIQTNAKLLHLSTEPDYTRKFKLQETIKVMYRNVCFIHLLC